MLGERLPGSVRYQGLLSGHSSICAGQGGKRLGVQSRTVEESGHTAGANPNDGWSALTAEGLSKPLSKHYVR